MDLVPERVRAVMADLHARDAADQLDGTPQAAKLRAIGPDVGRFLMTIAIATTAKTIIEVGTSGGYSTLWLATAAQKTGGRVITFEWDQSKLAIARHTFAAAGVEPFVDLREGDGGEGLAGCAGSADLVFIDSEKADYVRLLGLAITALRPGGLFVADNLVSHSSELVEFRARALADPHLSGLVIPIGGGELVAVRL